MKKSHFYIQISPFLKLHILVLPLIAASIWGGYFIEYSIAYSFALLHEAGHITAAYLLRTGISHIEILPFGVCGKLKSSIIKNPNHEMAVAAAGPVVSLATAFALILLNGCFAMPRILSAYSIKLNLSLAVINLLPAIPLDGGRIFRAYLTKKSNAGLSYVISAKVSLVIGILLFLSSVYALLSHSFNFSLIMISSFLLGNLLCEQKNITKNTLRELLCYNEKLIPNDFTPSYVTSADGSTPARKLLKRLSYDKYNVICVTDENLTITKILTEGQIIKALTEQSIRVTLDDIRDN